MRWAKVTLTYNYDLDELEENGWVWTSDEDLIELAQEDMVCGNGAWEVERGN